MQAYKVIWVVFLCSFLAWSCQRAEKKTEETNVATEKSEVSSPAIVTFEQWFKNPIPLISAHRGGPYPGFPENAIETFQNIVDQIPGVIIECDVSMTEDSVLVLMHDKTLDRTSTASCEVNHIKYSALKNELLIDNNGDTTSFKVPTLDDVLMWGKGKVLFTLDVKRGVPFEKVIATVERFDAESFAAIITYRIEDASLVYSLNSEVIISVSARDDGALGQIVKSGIPTKNLLGFVGTREPQAGHYEKLEQLGIRTILATLGNLDKSAEAKGDDTPYLTYFQNGADIIATDRPLEVARVLN